MNTKSTLHCRVYSILQIDSSSAAKLLDLFSQHGILQGAKFGSNEPARHTFTGKDNQLAVDLLSIQRTLVISNKKAGISIFIMWFVNRKRLWFWTIDFDKTWLNPGASQKIVSICQDLLRFFNPVQISVGLSEDWFEKHDVKDEKGNLLQRVGASFELGRGLPGIYWLNGFGKQLCAHFEDELPGLKHAAIVEFDDKQKLLFRAYPEPDSENERARRIVERSIVSQLGDKYFFDLEEAHRRRPKKRQGIEDISDATKL